MPLPSHFRPRRPVPTAASLRLLAGWLFLAVLVSIGHPPPAWAQNDLPADQERQSSPLELLLEHRAALALTTDQIGQLDQIREQLASTNEPLVAQMMSLRSQWQQERRTAKKRGGGADQQARIERIRADAEQLRSRIQENNRSAMQNVNRLLKPAQRKQLRGIVQDRKQQSSGRRAGGGANANSR